MNILDNLKDHWLWGIAALAAICISGTWVVSNELYVKPRDYEIQRLNTRITELKQKIEDLEKVPARSKDSDSSIVLEPTWVYGEKPITALSGQIQIIPNDLDIRSEALVFSIKSPDKEPVELQLRRGEMETFVFDDQTYLFHLLDTDHSSAIYGPEARAKIMLVRKK